MFSNLLTRDFQVIKVSDAPQTNPGEDRCICPQDCKALPLPEAICNDGIDEDCNEITDCDDTDCNSETTFDITVK